MFILSEYDSGNFSIKIHYGGGLVTAWNRIKYKRGQVLLKNWCNADQMTMVKLHNISREIGYQVETQMDNH